MPCNLFRHFHVLHFHALQFWWSVIFMSVIFSAPMPTSVVMLWFSYREWPLVWKAAKCLGGQMSVLRRGAVHSLQSVLSSVKCLYHVTFFIHSCHSLRSHFVLSQLVGVRHHPMNCNRLCRYAIGYICAVYADAEEYWRSRYHEISFNLLSFLVIYVRNVRFKKVDGHRRSRRDNIRPRKAADGSELSCCIDDASAILIPGKGPKIWADHKLLVQTTWDAYTVRTS